MPSNFRTYEAQSRLLAAVIASNPSMKLNFKDIAKYYGESTPQGIEFQFRAIRKDAKAIRDAVDKGESPLSTRKNVPSPSIKMYAVEASARKRKTPSVEPGAAARAAAGSSSGGARRASRKTSPVKRARNGDVVSFNEEHSLSREVDYDDLDITPVSTPIRGSSATAQASASASSWLGSTAASSIDLDATPSVPGHTAVPITPSTTFVPDATPALSIGATPSDNQSPDNADVFHTAQQTRQQQQPHFQQPQLLFQDQQQQQQPATTGMNQMLYSHNVNIAGDDDDDDDDEGFIFNTPSKVPKMEPGLASMPASMPAAMSAAVTAAVLPSPSPSQPHSFMASAGGGSDFGSSGSWDALGHHHQPQSQHGQQNNGSQSKHSFSFDVSSSWEQSDFFQATNPMSSFSQSTSFYDNDGAI